MLSRVHISTPCDLPSPELWVSSARIALLDAAGEQEGVGLVKPPYLELKLKSQLHGSRSANLIQRIEAATLGAASERRSQHLSRLPE